MTNDSPVQGKKKFVLTEIEKLDGSIDGVASAARGWFDRGKSAAELPEVIKRIFGVSITENMANNYRRLRWVPHKELVELKLAAITAAVQAFGGDAGFDAALLAKLWEMMDEMSVDQIIAARNLFVRVRAQNLKEQEFLFKTGQLKLAPADGVETDPQAQQQKVLSRIKEIFGLASNEPAALPAHEASPNGAQEQSPPESGGELAGDSGEPAHESSPNGAQGQSPPELGGEFAGDSGKPAHESSPNGAQEQSPPELGGELAGDSGKPTHESSANGAQEQSPSELRGEFAGDSGKPTHESSPNGAQEQSPGQRPG